MDPHGREDARPAETRDTAHGFLGNNIGGLYAGLIVISALGLIATWVLDELERFLVPWKRPR